MGKITGFFGGRVELSAKGCQTERFLSALYRMGLHPYRLIRTEEDCLQFLLPVREFKRLRAPAFKTGTRIRILKKKGFFRVIRPVQKRIGLAVGMALFLGLVYYSSGFIWQVEVRGCEQISY
ncbi:MAG: sporulation protein YqfD, partial [Clostridia bacterium]|nr:sporulation protein YqfD [Clostridia bacterium]